MLTLSGIKNTDFPFCFSIFYWRRCCCCRSRCKNRETAAEIGNHSKRRRKKELGANFGQGAQHCTPPVVRVSHILLLPWKSSHYSAYGCIHMTVGSWSGWAISDCFMLSRFQEKLEVQTDLQVAAVYCRNLWVAAACRATTPAADILFCRKEKGAIVSCTGISSSKLASYVQILVQISSPYKQLLSAKKSFWDQLFTK